MKLDFLKQNTCLIKSVSDNLACRFQDDFKNVKLLTDNKINQVIQFTLKKYIFRIRQYMAPPPRGQRTVQVKNRTLCTEHQCTTNVKLPTKI